MRPRFQIGLALALVIGAPLLVAFLELTSHRDRGGAAVLIGGLLLFEAESAPVWHIVGLRIRNALRVASCGLLAVGLALCVRNGAYPASLVVGVVLAVLPSFFALWSRRVASVRFPVAPVGPGTYLIVHGGAPGVGNRHAGVKAQRFAVDLVRLDAHRRRATGLLPAELDAYASYGAPVVAVDAGPVLEVGQASANAIPGEPELKPDPRGNYVIQRAQGRSVVYAHLAPGSLTVKAGDELQEGQKLGEIGNSGYSTEPHLHIHVEADGLGAGFRFQGLVPRRNQAFTVDQDGRVLRIS